MIRRVTSASVVQPGYSTSGCLQGRKEPDEGCAKSRPPGDCSRDVGDSSCTSITHEFCNAAFSSHYPLDKLACRVKKLNECCFLLVWAQYEAPPDRQQYTGSREDQSLHTMRCLGQFPISTAFLAIPKYMSYQDIHIIQALNRSLDLPAWLPP